MVNSHNSFQKDYLSLQKSSWNLQEDFFRDGLLTNNLTFFSSNRRRSIHFRSIRRRPG
jgi:hypothetical protein